MRPAITIIVATAATIVLAVLIAGSDSGSEITVALPSANGLRDGSPVRMGGGVVGEIDELRLADDDTPRATIRLDDDVTLTSAARAEVVTSNLLGSKYLLLYPGTGTSDIADGGSIPASRVTVPSDLDQVLNALTPDVRARLQILINETGTFITGRKTDFRRAMQLLPQDLDAGAALLAQLQVQNGNLRRLVADSSTLVARLAPERRSVARLVQTAAEVTAVTAERRVALRATLATAPGALRSLTTALGELDRTAAPLGPAARHLARSAPPLRQTLAALPEFERSAAPTLARLRSVAPKLTDLGTDATPILRRAQPALGELATLVSEAAPVSRAVDVSVDDLLGFLEGWGRAIQTRDGVSHVFRGRATVGPESLRSLLSRLPKGASRPRRKGRPTPPRAAPDKPTAPLLAPGRAPKLPKPSKAAVEGALKGLDEAKGAVGRLTDTLPRTTGDADVASLLDYLLGD